MTRDEAARMGVSDKELSRFTSDGRLTRIGRGVYRIKHHVPGNLDPCLLYTSIACDYLASAGYSRLYLYAGSMNDWIRDPARPVEASSVAFAKAS